MGVYKNKEISKFTCEFKDKELEKRFFKKTMKKDMKLFRGLILILAIIYLLFIIPDFLILDNLINFQQIISIRIINFIALILLYFYIKKLTNYNTLSYLISMAQASIIISYFIITNSYSENWNYFIKIFDIILFLLVIYILPNKLLNKFIISNVLKIVFFYTAYQISDIDTMDFLSGIVYTSIIHLVLFLLSYKISYHQRTKHLSDMELKYLSEIDNLTGIYNRNKLDIEVEKWIKLKQRYGFDLSIIFLDFDNFKEINDEFGHVEADNILKKSVKKIEDAIRETDIFGRWGGDEFVVLLPKANKTEAVKLAERIRNSLKEENENLRIPVTCSYGVTSVHKEDSLNKLLDRVDSLMYDAKDAGRDKVVS
ncbi:MAG: GGDEF domain-containing protein [Bacillota bacterium]|nr:GGDEF domain-containing protein [Bacillota bacterium]